MHWENKLLYLRFLGRICRRETVEFSLDVEEDVLIVGDRMGLAVIEMLSVYVHSAFFCFSEVGT